MRTFIAALVMLTLAGCISQPPDAKSTSGTTHVSLSGTTGAAITGYYVQKGQRTAISSNIPWSMTGTGISEFEIRKSDPADRVVISMRYEGAGTRVASGAVLDAKTRAARVRVSNGFKVTTYSR